MKCSVAIELMKKDLMATGCTIKEMEVFLRYAELLYYVGVDAGLEMSYDHNRRAVLQLKDGVVIHRYRSITTAANTLNTTSQTISAVLRGVRNSWFGYTFEYE